jgi:peptidoglycan/LPS O-acetylase OafA/YrhL
VSDASPTPAPDASTERPTDWLLDGAHQRRVVDGIRALGIVLVVAFHAAFLTTKLLPREPLERFIHGLPQILNIVWQALGSEIVFLASGFLLSYILIREHLRYGSIDFGQFYVRRVSRIVPLFLLALAVYSIGRSLHPDRVLANLLFVSRAAGYFEIGSHTGKNYIPVGWSLEVMMQVFLALPFVVWALLRSRWPLLVAVLLTMASVAPRYAALSSDVNSYTQPYYELVFGGSAPQIQKDLYYLTWFRLTPFLLGLVGAILVTVHRERVAAFLRSPARAGALAALGVALFLASGSLPLHDPEGAVYAWFGPQAWHWFWTVQRAVLGLGVLALLLAVLHQERGFAGVLGRGLALRMWQPISAGIYSIYLFHFACLLPAALVVFSPSVVRTALDTESFAPASFDRKDFVARLGQNLDGVTLWHYLAMVAIAVWLSTKLATFLTRKLEAPSQAWLRRRFPGRQRTLVRGSVDRDPSREGVCAQARSSPNSN